VFIAKLLAFRQQIDSQKSIKIGKIFQGNHLISDWLRNKLHDQDLARVALDLMDAKEMGADERLLRLLVQMAPDLPPLYREYSLALTDLEGLATQAMEENSQAIDLLKEIYEKRSVQDKNKLLKNILKYRNTFEDSGFLHAMIS
jgi:hypothetical protein